jgi:fatty acid elongase 3
MPFLHFPTLDRPFGFHLWGAFDRVLYDTTGYQASKFRFVPGKTPLSTWQEVVAIIIAYYVIIFSGRDFMKNRPAFRLNTWFQIHNIFLTLLSGILWALLFEQIVPIIVRHGLFYSICNVGAWTQPLVFIYYVCRVQSVFNNLLTTSLIT